MAIVRRAFDAVHRRDFEGAARYFSADKVEWHNTAAFPGPETLRGLAAIIEFWHDLYGSFEEGEPATIEKVRAAGDCVVIGARTRGHGKASGVPVDVRWALTYRLHDGRIERVDARGDYAKALEAAGLSE